MKLHEIARQARALGIVMGENSGNRERQEKLTEMRMRGIWYGWTEIITIWIPPGAIPVIMAKTVPQKSM